jgi:hypothetical protein
MNITLVYQTPKFSNRAVRLVASDWTLGSTIQARSGAPLDIVTNVNPDPATGFGSNSAGSQRPNQVLSNAYATHQGASCGAAGALCEQWLNPAAFAAPATGTYGDVGVYDLVGPAFWQWDMALSRAFPILEHQRIELRAEAFNVTNSLRLGNPGTTFGTASTFGLITTDATPPAGVTNGSATNAPARVMQFALKYVF